MNLPLRSLDESFLITMCFFALTTKAVHLRSPLLRPSMSSTAGNTFGGPAQLLNERGSLLVLPEDLTGPFGRYLGICHSKTLDESFLKSICILL